MKFTKTHGFSRIKSFFVFVMIVIVLSSCSIPAKQRRIAGISAGKIEYSYLRKNILSKDDIKNILSILNEKLKQSGFIFDYEYKNQYLFASDVMRNYRLDKVKKGDGIECVVEVSKKHVKIIFLEYVKSNVNTQDDYENIKKFTSEVRSRILKEYPGLDLTITIER